MLLKTNLTLHSRMSGSWWLFGSLRYFLYNSSVYSCYLFLISSASIRSIPFLSFIVLIFAWNVLFVSLIFLKRSLVFPILFSLHWSLRKAFLLLFISSCYSLELWFRWICLSFSPLPFTSLCFSAICKASSDNHFTFLNFSFLGTVLITTSWTMSWTSIHTSSGTPSIRCYPLNLFVTSTVQL